MSENPFCTTISPAELPALVYSQNAKIGELLEKSLSQIGFVKIKVVSSEADAVQAMGDFLPRVVILFANIGDAADLAIVKAINKTRASTNRRTPKILAMLTPSLEDILTAKGEGFWDVLPLPATVNVIAGRLETVITRLD